MKPVNPPQSPAELADRVEAALIATRRHLAEQGRSAPLTTDAVITEIKDKKAAPGMDDMDY